MHASEREQCASESRAHRCVQFHACSLAGEERKSKEIKRFVLESAGRGQTAVSILHKCINKMTDGSADHTSKCIRDLAPLGNSGKSPRNVARDLYKWTFKELDLKGKLELYEVKCKLNRVVRD